MDLAQFGLADSQIDDVALFWHHGNHRRAIVTGDYRTTHSHLGRALKILHAQWVEQSIASQLSRLYVSGEAITATVRDHRIGLMRPALNGQSTDAPQPFLIAAELRAGIPAFPVLSPNRDAAVKVWRRLAIGGVAQQDCWREYKCERPKSPIEQLTIQIKGGKVVSFKSELERLMWFVEHPRGRPRTRAA